MTVTDHGRPIARIVPVERLTRLELEPQRMNATNTEHGVTIRRSS